MALSDEGVLAILLDGRPIRVPVSGVARYCLSLANAFARLHVKGELDQLLPDVLVQSERGINRTIDALDPRLNTIELNMFGRSRKTQNIVTEFFPLLAAGTALHRYDLVHETYFANLAYSPWQRKVSTIHDTFPMEFPNLFNRNNRMFARRNFERQVRMSDQIIAVSSYTKQRIVELSGCAPERVNVIGCGVDVSDSEQAQMADWPIAGILHAGDPFCLYVGNIEPRKNLGALIEAWTMLAPRHRSVKLIIAGKLNYRAEATIARGYEQLGSRFAYLGQLSEPDKWGALKSARSIILPSLYEGYGIPIIEGYVAGKLALFARTSSMIELAMDDRQMFDPRSTASMVETIDHALDDPPWTIEVRTQASRWVAGHSWEHVAREVADVYRAALAQ